MARDRTGVATNVASTRTTAAQEAQALQPMPPKDTTLCTDGNHALATTAPLLEVQRYGVNVSTRVHADVPSHAQDVSAYVGRLRRWMLFYVKSVDTKRKFVHRVFTITASEHRSARLKEALPDMSNTSAEVFTD